MRRTYNYSRIESFCQLFLTFKKRNDIVLRYMDQNSVSHRTLKNATYTLLNYVIPIAFSVFLTPIIVRKLGLNDYGVFILLNTIAGFLGLLDLGTSVALTRYIALLSARKEFERLKIIVQTAQTLYVGLGIVGLAAFMVLGRIGLSWFKIPLENQPHIWVVFFLMGIFFFINSINSVLTVAPGALQRFDILSKLSLLQLVLMNFGTLALLLLGYKLKAILGVQVLVVFVISLLFWWRYVKLLPEVPLGLKFSWKECKEIYRFGLLASIMNISSGSFTQLDRLYVPMRLGPNELTYYSLPGNVAQKTSGVIGSIVGVLFPLASSMESEGQVERLAAIYRRSVRNVFVIGAAFTVAMSVFSYKILFFWVGKPFADRGWQILIILALTYFLIALYGLLSQVILGLGHVGELAGWASVVALVNLLLLFVLVPIYGIIGAAWAYLGGAFVMPFIMVYLERKFLKVQGNLQFYIRLLLKNALVSGIFCLLFYFGVLPWVRSIWVLLVVGPGSLIVYIFIYDIFGFFEREDRELLLGFGRRIKARFVS